MDFADVTPNLVVSNVPRSTAFYTDVLGFAVVRTVPEEPPHAFVWLRRGNVNVFLNAAAAEASDVPEWGGRVVAGTNGMFITIEAESIAGGIDALFRAADGKARVLMPLKDQFYGMREFTIRDPDGYVLTFAQRV